MIEFKKRSPWNVKKNGPHEMNEYVEKNEYDLDQCTIDRGRFTNNYDFIILYVLSSIGSGNINSFPKLVNLYGGSTFIIVYFFLSFILSIPLLLIETGLSQFYSFGAFDLFKVIPFFKGFGWTICLLSFVKVVLYSSMISWTVIYIVDIFQKPNLPWLYCTTQTLAVTCENMTNSLKKLSSTVNNPAAMYFDFVVTKSRKPDGIPYTIFTALDGINTNSLVMILIVWFMIMIHTLFITNMAMKINYIILFYMCASLLVLTLKFLFLPGSMLGLYHYLRPDLDKLLTLNSFYSLLSHILFSICMLNANSTYASLNKFKYDFLKAILLVSLMDFLYSFFAGIMVFSMLGSLSVTYNTEIEMLVKNDYIFVMFITACKDSNFWVLLMMTLIFIAAMTCNSVVCGSLSISIYDHIKVGRNFPFIKKSVISILLCCFLTFLSLFLSLNGSSIYVNFFYDQIGRVSGPLIFLFEIVLIHIVYSGRRLRMECKMMLGYSYNACWNFVSLSVLPLMAIFLFAYSMYIGASMDAPIWVLRISYLISFVLLSPLIIFFFSQVYINYKAKTDMNIFELGLHTPNVLGPYYKKNWLLSHYYQNKLLEVRLNPEFIKNIRETEDMDQILRELIDTRRSKHSTESRSSKKTSRDKKSLNENFL